MVSISYLKNKIRSWRADAVHSLIKLWKDFTLLRSITFRENFETEGCKHENIFSIFLCDFRCVKSLMSATLVFQPWSLTCAVSSNDLKWAKENKYKRKNVYKKMLFYKHATIHLENQVYCTLMYCNLSFSRNFGYNILVWRGHWTPVWKILPFF